MNVMRGVKKVFSVCNKNMNLIHLVAVSAAVAMFSITSQTVFAANVYDTRVLERIKFTKAQRAEVIKIVRQSDKDLDVVFKKYDIDPNEKPVLRKLIEASKDLKAIESSEKKKMKKILSDEQYIEYLELLWETASRVINATRTED